VGRERDNCFAFEAGKSIKFQTFVIGSAGQHCNSAERAMLNCRSPARNEYLAAESRILKARLIGRLQLSDAERATLASEGSAATANNRARPTRRHLS
jgi:hypothetical protein